LLFKESEDPRGEIAADDGDFYLRGPALGGLDAETSLLLPDDLEATAFASEQVDVAPGGLRPYQFLPVGVRRAEVKNF